MRAFVAGLVTGAAVVGFLWWAMAPRPADAPAAPPQTSRAVTPPSRAIEPRRPGPADEPREAATRRGDAAPERPDSGEEEDAPFPPGEAILHIGEGYVFGETHARRRGDTAEADVVCLDAGATNLFHCPRGGRIADVPLAVLGLPTEPRAAAALVADAPDDLGPGDVDLDVWCAPDRPGVALVRSGGGTSYKVILLAADDDRVALRRRVRIAYSEVPARRGGGRVALPTAAPAQDSPSLSDVERIVAAGTAVPGDSMAEYLRGSYVRPSAMPAELVLERREHFLLDEPLATSLEFRDHNGLFAARGIAAAGRVRIEDHTGVAVRGDMAGEIESNSHSFIHISGNLTGKMTLTSFATVVVDGDLTGEAVVSGSVSFLLRGRLAGKLSIRGGSSQFWFQQYMARGTAELLVDRDSGSNSLHLRTSDAPAGSYDDVKGWSEVVVGEDAWSVITK